MCLQIRMAVPLVMILVRLKEREYDSDWAGLSVNENGFIGEDNATELSSGVTELKDFCLLSRAGNVAQPAKSSFVASFGESRSIISHLFHFFNLAIFIPGMTCDSPRSEKFGSVIFHISIFFSSCDHYHFRSKAGLKITEPSER